MRLGLFIIAFVSALTIQAQWEVVQSGTDSALYCVSSSSENYFIGGATNTLIKSPKDVLNFADTHQEYDLIQEFNPIIPGITKIGIVNDSALFFKTVIPGFQVADSSTVYRFYGGASMQIDSSLTIIVEEQADVYVDTSIYEYFTDPEFIDEGAVANVGTISWVLRSLDGGESYDIGTLIMNYSYVLSSHASSAKNVGIIDWDGRMHISTDSALTFTQYALPWAPHEYSASITPPVHSPAFYFNDNLNGFVAGPGDVFSSLYKVDISSGEFTSTGLSVDFNWNRITMTGSQFVIAVGDSGMVATSFDQGETWNVENIGTELDLYGVESDGQGNFIIVGDSGLILTNSAPLVDFIEITSAEDLFEIDSENGTLQLSATVFPESAPQNVSWSMVNLSGTANIDQNGLVTAQGNGLVMAVASIPEPPGFTEESEAKSLSSSDATFFILISGQSLGEQYLFGSDTTICGIDILTVNLPSSVAEVEWSDGSTELSFEINEAGTYWVTVTDGDFIRSDSIQVAQFPYPEFSLGEDVIACSGDDVSLEAPIFGNYEWSTGSDESGITISESGEYGLGITLNGCSSFDEINVSFLEVTEFDLGEDISLCEGESTILSAPIEGEYSWYTGSTDSEIFVEEEGWVVLEIFDGECSFEDSLFLEVKPLPEFSLGADTVICDTTSIVLEAFVDGATYQWSDGSESSFIEVAEEGEYSVLITLDGCSSEDDITIGLIDCALSTSSENSEVSLKIFPNPATDVVTVEISEKLVGASVSVFSSTGKLIGQLNQNSIREEFDVSGWPKGIYLIRIEKSGMAVTKELVLF